MAWAGNIHDTKTAKAGVHVSTSDVSIIIDYYYIFSIVRCVTGTNFSGRSRVRGINNAETKGSSRNIDIRLNDSCA